MLYDDERIRLQKMLKLTGRSDFFRAVVVLTSGAALAHAITALALPILARLYTPSQFGELSVIVGIVGIVGAISCLRYDVAISLPESDVYAMALFFACSISTIFVPITAGLILYIIDWCIRDAALTIYLNEYGNTIIFGSMLYGFNNTLQNWNIRNKNFRTTSSIKVIQTMMAIGVQLIGGGFNFEHGLVYGAIINFGVVSFLFISYLILNKKVVSNKKTIIKSVVKYKKFPIYSTWEALFNMAAIQLPIVVMSFLFGANEVGYIAMAGYVAQAPMALLGSSISQVYLSEAKKYSDSKLTEYTKNIALRLLKIGGVPIIAMCIFAPLIFPLLFGEKWSKSGYVLFCMAPGLLFQFIASPISMALHITGNQRTALIVQIAGLIFRVAAIYFAFFFQKNLIIEIYALSGGVFYCAYLFIILKSVDVNIKYMFIGRGSV